MVLVEAQSYEKPVIAGDSGGTAETMIIGETGYILDCTNTKQLEEKIPELLKDKEKLIQMGKKARKHIVQTLDWQVHTEKAKKLFKKMGLFGSYALGEANKNSDIDIAVELDSKNSFRSFFSLLYFLEKGLKNKIDLDTEHSLKPLAKEKVLKEIIYVE